MLTNSGMGKQQNIPLKSFSILAFKSRQKIHSSLKDDERLNMGPTKIRIENNFTHYTPRKYDILLPSNSLWRAVGANTACNRLGMVAGSL